MAAEATGGGDELLRRGASMRHLRASRRVRLEIPGLRGDPAWARRLGAALARLPWVTEVHASPASGRVLICYGAATSFSRALLDRSIAIDRGGALAHVSAPPAPTVASTPWHGLSVDQACARLGSSAVGLSTPEAAATRALVGLNAVSAFEARTRLQVLIGQVNNLPMMLLLCGAGASLLLGDVLDAATIGLVVALNAGIGYRIERKNEALLESWRRLEAGLARVIRDGVVTTLLATELVPGDVVLLRAGDAVPADARVLEAQGLACDEAPLTGESEPQEKECEAMPVGVPLGERRSMLYAGTIVTAGRGRAVIVATGPRTEVAAVRRLVESLPDPETPLQRRLEVLGRRATALALGASGLMVVGGLLRGRTLTAVIRTGVALGVAAIPEGLPVVATAALVHSMNRMRASGIVVRRLVSAETLGGVTVVCMDKTGTLTANDMRLDVLEVDGRAHHPGDLRASLQEIPANRIALTLAAGVLNSDIDVHNGHTGLELSGSSTERALVAAAQGAGLSVEELRHRFPRRLLRERADGIHYVTSVHDGPEGLRLALVKGAPEQVLPLCERDVHGPLDDQRRRALLERNDALARRGSRVLAQAWKELRAAEDHDLEAEGFDFLGLVALRDPLRPGAAEAVQAAARAGIRTMILTGDQRATALAIAREVGLAGEAVEGAALAAALAAGSPEAHARLDRIAVCARVSPTDKVAIVRALRERGEIVAMAGDGINDAPALRAADVGIAVGAHASDIARQTADVVLETADLRSILAAVGEGRIVQDNLRRAVRFLFASNSSEVILMLAGLAAPHDPLTALQLLWLNLVTDTLPALALAREPGDPAVLARRPSPPAAPLLSRADFAVVARDGALLAALAGAANLIGGPLTTFGTLAGAQLGYTVACRPQERPMDLRFTALLASAFGLQLAAMLIPPLRFALRLPRPGVLPLGGLGLGALLAPAIRQIASSLTRLPPSRHHLHIVQERREP